MASSSRHSLADAVSRRCTRATVGLLTGLLAWGAAIAADARAGKPPAPYAVIDWRDQLNPDFVALGQAFFLLDTKSGVKVWDAGANAMAPAGTWPASLRVGWVWSDVAEGRIVVGRAGDGPKRFSEQLVLWRASSRDFSPPWPLPANEAVLALLSVDPRHVLVCVRTSGPDQSKDATRAFLVAQQEGGLRIDASPARFLRAMLRAKGVTGEVAGLGALKEGTPLDDDMPLRFNTRGCQWEMTRPPPELAGIRDLRIKPYRLPDGRWLVGQAAWYDSVVQHWRQLTAPYVWQAAAKQWQAIEKTAKEGNSGSAMSNHGLHDAVVSVSVIRPDFIEFLDPVSLRWTRSEQTLDPDAYGPVVAPFRRDEVLVFLHERGEVLRFSPMRQPVPGQFAHSHSYIGEVPLRDGSVVLLNGGDDGRPSNRPESLRVRPQPSSRLIAPLPRPLGQASGLALPDGGILAFGGLSQGCVPYSSNASCTPSNLLPAYRYMPAADRWAEVPDLRLDFANGQPWSFGNSSITTQWARQDAWVRHNGDAVFLEGPSLPRLRFHDMTPPHAQVLRWRPGEPVKVLGRLRQARTSATLLELDDRRLVALGGMVARRLDVDPEVCDGCDVIEASTGAVDTDTSTELYDEGAGRWVAGPPSNHPGGRAYKLANGRIFKLSTMEPWSSEKGYQSEVADAAFTHWKTLPPFPLQSVNVWHVAVAGNRVLIQMDEPSTQTVVWDDERQRWLVWNLKTAQRPVSIIPIDANHGIARSYQTYELVTFPK